MFRILALFRYFLYKVNEHSLHSPLIYDLYRKIIKPSKHWKSDLEIESIRFELSKSSLEIDVTDFGTGKGRNPVRSVSEIVKGVSSSPSKSVLLKSIAEYFECEHIVELGTSFGLNSLYLSRIPNAKVTTFEGCKNTADIANANFIKLGAENIKLIIGDIDRTLPYYLDRSEKIDFVYFDANHAYQPTMNYYHWCQNRAHDESVFIFDDIHYSPEMEKAWEEIKNQTEVLLSIDLFSLGIILFDPSLRKQHYVLEY